MSVPASTESDLWLGYDDYYRLVERLCLAIHESGWKFDQILCLARGGLRVGDVVSRIFDLPLAILSTSSYREDAGTKQGELDIAQYITMSRGIFGGRVLLVDDLVDSGMTLEKVGQHLRRRFPEVTEVRSAVIWWKGSSKVEPDYYVEHLPTNPWIHQPFEEYDSLRPQQLEAWIRRGVRGR
ncbi:MAG: phosphoribosyltransferase [Burkholderiaceae bacterium]